VKFNGPHDPWNDKSVKNRFERIVVWRDWYITAKFNHGGRDFWNCFSDPFYEFRIQSVVSQDSYVYWGLNHEAYSMNNIHEEYAQI
jgi:hypothetical protein